MSENADLPTLFICASEKMVVPEQFNGSRNKKTEHKKGRP